MLILTEESEIICNVLFGHTWYNNEWTLGWLIERIKSSNIIVLEIRFLEPLPLLNLKLSFKIHKLWWKELWDLFVHSSISYILSQSFSIGKSVFGDTRKHLVSLVSFTCNNLGSWWCSWAECLGDNNTNWVLDSSTTLFLKNYLEMSWSSDIQEILWVSAPVLIFFSLFIYTSSTC